MCIRDRSHQDKKSLIGQADDRLQKMTQAGVGRSKHQDKIDDVDYKYIYTWKTYQAYIKHCCYFLDWCKENHGCKTLKQCRQYVPEWMCLLYTSAVAPPLDSASR